MTRFRGTALTATGLLLVAGAGAGCAAGQSAETSVQYQTTDGVVADVGAIAMRDMYVYTDQDEIAPGDSGYIRVSVFNGDTHPDTLTGASADKGTIEISAGGTSPSPTASLPLPSTSQSFPEGQTGTGSPSPSPSGTAGPPKPAESLQASPTNPPSPQASSGGGEVPLPPSTVVRFDDPSSGSTGATMKFTNTSGKTLRTGSSIAITFTYRDAGSVSALVPIESPNDTTETATPVPSPSELQPTLIVPPGGSATPSPSASPGDINISISPSPHVTVVPPSPAATP